MVINNLGCQLNLELTKIQVSRNSCEGLEGLSGSDYLIYGSPPQVESIYSGGAFAVCLFSFTLTDKLISPVATLFLCCF